MGQAVFFRADNLPKTTSCWGSKGLFLKVFSAVDFPESLRSREWRVTEGGGGAPKSIQMLPALKWYFLIQLPPRPAPAPPGLKGMLLARTLPPLSTQHKF